MTIEFSFFCKSFLNWLYGIINNNNCPLNFKRSSISILKSTTIEVCTNKNFLSLEFAGNKINEK